MASFTFLRHQGWRTQAAWTKNREIINLKKEIKSLEKKNRKVEPKNEVTRSKINQESYKCEICDAEWMTEKGLKTHMVDKHETENNSKFVMDDDKNTFTVRQNACTNCDEIFTSKDDFKKHNEHEHKKLVTPFLSTALPNNSTISLKATNSAPLSFITTTASAPTSLTSETFSNSTPTMSPSPSSILSSITSEPDPTFLSSIPHQKDSLLSRSYTPPGSPPPFCSEPSKRSSTNAEDIIKFAERFNIRMEEQTEELMSVIKENFKFR